MSDLSNTEWSYIPSKRFRKESHDCDLCDKSYSTSFNLNRHVIQTHDEASDSEDSDVEMSDNDTEEYDSDEENDNNNEIDSDEEDDNDSDEEDDNDSDDEDDTDDEDDNETDTDEADDNDCDEEKILTLNTSATKRVMEPLKPLLHQLNCCTMELVRSGKDEDEAFDETYQDHGKKLNRAFRKSIVDLLIDMETLRTLPLIQQVLKKARDFERKGYDYDNALNAAMSRRKHIFGDLARKILQSKTTI